MKRYFVCCGGPSWARAVWERISELPGDWTRYDANINLVNPHVNQFRYVFFLNYSAIVREPHLSAWECVNLHAAPLPYGRGGGPIENMILRGHTETVITAHRMVEELDAGPIYGTRGPISLAGTKPEILDRFIVPCVDLISRIIATEKQPYQQAGPVVPFRRLPKAKMEALWQNKSW